MLLTNHDPGCTECVSKAAKQKGNKRVTLSSEEFKRKRSSGLTTAAPMHEKTAGNMYLLVSRNFNFVNIIFILGPGKSG